MILQAVWNGIQLAGKPRASGDDPTPVWSAEFRVA